MAKNYNSAKSNTSTSVKSDSEGGGKALEEFSASPGGDHHSTRGNTTSIEVGGGGKDPQPEMDKDYNSAKSNTSTSIKSGDGGGPGKPVPDSATAIEYGLIAAEAPGGGGGKEPIREAAGDYNSTRSNTTSIKSGGGSSTTGLKSTLGLIKSGFILATVVVLVAAGADVYKMYDDHVTINLEDHITDANFWLTSDKNSIVGDIGFDIPKMGYFEKSIDTQIHLKIQESEPDLNDVFYFEYTLGSGEMIYDKFELNNLDPVTKDKIDKGEPLHIEYTVTITIIYLGVELGPTTSEVGTKVTTIQTASES